MNSMPIHFYNLDDMDQSLKDNLLRCAQGEAYHLNRLNLLKKLNQ